METKAVSDAAFIKFIKFIIYKFLIVHGDDTHIQQYVLAKVLVIFSIGDFLLIFIFKRTLLE